MKKLIKILTPAAALCVCAAMTGCGSTQIDLNSYIEVDFAGYDTVGTATAFVDFEGMIEDHPEAFGLEEDYDDDDVYSVYSRLVKEIEGELDEDEELANGDIVAFEWDSIDTEKLEERYSIKLAYEDAEFTVDGLDELESFDPFDYVSVTFSGIAPNGSAEITVSSDIPVAMSFTADVSYGLDNGDVVTVSAGDLDDLRDRCISYGKLPTESESKFTVEGLASYVQKIDDIPAAAADSMKKQADDALAAYGADWADDNYIKNSEFLGYYLISAKEGAYTRTNNEVYLVYKITSSVTGLKRGGDGETKETAEEVFYTYYRFTDLLLETDGSCTVDLSRGSMCNNSIESDYGYWSFFTATFYRYSGYKSLDEMFEKVITNNLESYNYESTVTDSAMA